LVMAGRVLSRPYFFHQFHIQQQIQ